MRAKRKEDNVKELKVRACRNKEKVMVDAKAEHRRVVQETREADENVTSLTKADRGNAKRCAARFARGM